MPEHRIRLRGAWDRLDLDDPGSKRVDLPIAWSVDDSARPFRLLRKFGGPAIDPTTQAVALELVDVSGLLSVRLNGQRLDQEGRSNSIKLDEPLRARNVLELEVDLSGADPIESWGSIALVIYDRAD